MNKLFRFDEENHIYWLGDERLPSVTEILQPLIDYSMVSKKILERAGNYGTAVHKACALWMNDNLDESTLDEELRPILLSFQNWYYNNKGLLEGKLIIEKPTYHEKLKYGGTPDIVGDEIIVDIKTGQKNPLPDSVQLAAYEKLYPEFPHKKLYVLYLKPDGYDFIKVQNRQAWSQFRFLLDYYRASEKIKTWKGT